MKIRRPLLLGCLPILIITAGISAWFVARAIPLIRYNHRSQGINEKIKALAGRRPANVSPELWQECVAWASIAEGNICFSEKHASYETMCRFERQLDEKLKNDIDLATIEWIGDRLAETGPHGQQYMAKWREQWKAMQKQLKQERLP